MKISKHILATFAVFFFMSLTNTTYAQSSTVSATGTVLEPITISGTNLSFGASIFPGIDEAVAITETGAAQFDIDGETGKEVSLTFTLPTELTHDTDGSTTMPISFGTAAAGYNAGLDDPSAASTFDPNAGTSTTLGTSSGLLYVYLGGTVSPPSTQKAGSYTGSIVLDVAYTGN